MSEELSRAESGYLAEAVELLGDLRRRAPEIPGHSLAAFDSCRSLCQMLLGTGGGDESADEDFWGRDGGDNELDGNEIAAMQELVVALRRVVNGCKSLRPSLRRSVAASTELAELWTTDESANPLRAVAG